MKHNKWSVLIGAVCMQLVLGVIYIWGIFQPVVASHYDWSISTVALVFSIMLAFMTIGCIVGGKLQDIYSPRPVVMGSGIIIGVGTFLASYTPSSSPMFLYVTYGMMVGLGIGAIYTTTIALARKWFVDNKAFGTGVVLSALGLGGVIFTPIAQSLLTEYGVPKTFMILSIVFLVVCTVGGFFMVNPKEFVENNQELTGFSTNEMLRSRMYYVVTFTMMLSLPAFFMLSPLVKILCGERGISGDMATYVVMAFSILNSSGRFIAPQISQKIGAKKTIFTLNVITIASCVGMMFAGAVLSVVLMCTIAICFGGFLGVFPGVSSKMFGIKNAASNYGFVFIGYGVSAIFAPSIYEFAGRWGNFAPFAVVALCSVGSMILSKFMVLPEKSEEMPSKPILEKL